MTIELKQEKEEISRKLTDLDADSLEYIINLLDVNDLSKLTATYGFFRNKSNERREREYRSISRLLERYSFPMPLDHPNRFQSNLIKSASIVETQIRNIEKRSRCLLRQLTDKEIYGVRDDDFKYLFYTQLPVEDIRADSLDLALKYFNNYLASWLIKPENKSNLKLSVATLHYAVLSGNLDLVKWLMHVDRGSNMVRPNGPQQMLSDAAVSGNLKLVEYLMYSKNIRPLPCLISAAASSGNLELVQWLLDDARGNQCYRLNEQMLGAAAKSGNLDLVKWIMGIYRDVSWVRIGLWEQQQAAASGSIKLLEWLMHADRQADRVIPNQMTLKLAAESGNLELVQWLVDAERGDDRLRPDHTTLNDAAGSGNQELVQWLVDGEYRVRADQDTLRYAAGSGNLELVKWLVDAERGADRPRPDQDTLNWAASSGNQELVQWLKEYRAAEAQLPAVANALQP